MSESGSGWVMPEQERRRRPILALGVAIASACLCFLSLSTSVMSVMMFDAPGSDKNPYLWALFFGVFGAPLVFLGSCLVSLSAYIWRWPRLTRVAIFLPLALLLYIIAAIVVLEARCTGSFTCGGV